MTRLAIGVLAFSLITISSAYAQTRLDEKAVHNLPQAFCAAFNKHDGHQLAQIMAEDIDFVTVGATWLANSTSARLRRVLYHFSPCVTP